MHLHFCGNWFHDIFVTALSVASVFPEWPTVLFRMKSWFSKETLCAQITRSYLQRKR